MRHIFILLSIFVFTACGPGYEEPDTAIDAGRQFIGAIYNGNFKRAGQLIVKDDTNRKTLKENIEKEFRSRNGFEKTALSKASIQIKKITVLDSALTQIQFLNAFTTKEALLEVKKADGIWKVDISKMY